MLKSQRSRAENPEVDPLLLGSGWSPEDLEKPQILVESTFGDSHPGSRHLNDLADAAREGILTCGAKPAVYTTTDICDGIATGHDGMNYSLLSRDIMSAMVEIHARCLPFDAMVTISSCDKALPAHLMTIARLNIPALHVCGGSMMPGPELSSAVTCYEHREHMRRGAATEERNRFFQINACSTCGACQYMGTASTMQTMAEALGLSLPGTALMPAWSNSIRFSAQRAGNAVAALLKNGIRPRDILSRESFENAIAVHAALSGSTNALLHLPAVAAQAGIDITPADFGRLHARIPVLAGLQTFGPWPTQFLWYAGGVPRIMQAIKPHLHLDVLTVSGQTLADNLAALEKSGFFENAGRYLKNFNLKPEDIVQPLSHPYRKTGGIRILTGNIAPGGAVVKHAAVADEKQQHTGPARPFDAEEAAIAAILDGRIAPGDVVIIRYEGPRGSGMPEMFKTTEILYHHSELKNSVALVTDGRFSGATRGPAVGHVTPEAADAGPIALIKRDDVIHIDMAAQTIDIMGEKGKTTDPDAVKRLLMQRAARHRPKPIDHQGLLGLYTRSAGSIERGATLFE